MIFCYLFGLSIAWTEKTGNTVAMVTTVLKSELPWVLHFYTLTSYKFHVFIFHSRKVIGVFCKMQSAEPPAFTAEHSAVYFKVCPF